MSFRTEVADLIDEIRGDLISHSERAKNRADYESNPDKRLIYQMEHIEIERSIKSLNTLEDLMPLALRPDLE